MGPTLNERIAAELGYPSSLFGFTPDQQNYWREPGLPWLTEEIRSNPPLGYNDLPLLWHIAHVQGQRMAPRFPNGCAVNFAPVGHRVRLVVGRVYLYAYTDRATGQPAYELGRLAAIGGTYLVAEPDNAAMPSLWVLRAKEREAVWDVYEVTHYVTYPAL